MVRSVSKLLKSPSMCDRARGASLFCSLYMIELKCKAPILEGTASEQLQMLMDHRAEMKKFLVKFSEVSCSAADRKPYLRKITIEKHIDELDKLIYNLNDHIETGECAKLILPLEH